MTDERCVEEFSLLGPPPLRWGIAAPGEIAADFVHTLQRHTTQRVDAVASRSLGRAEAFGERFGIPMRYGSYDELADSDIDVVYVAAIHPAHAEIALRAIEGRKHVLVEKPMATNASDAERIADAATRAGVLAMEAMWTRYTPTYVELARQIDAGALGDIRMASVSVGWRAEREAAARLWDPESAGGVTLDMGVYGFWFAQYAIGRPTSVRAIGQMVGGVDAQVVVALGAGDGRLASVSSTMTGSTGGRGEIVGTEATAHILDHVVFAGGLEITGASGARIWRDRSGLTGRQGLAWQAVALATYVAEGRTDSPVHSLADTIALAETMDIVRAQVGQGDVDGNDATARANAGPSSTQGT
jgi:predicted dehydrogenase